MALINGRVKWFNDTKGWGFIEAPEGSERDVFVHYSVIRKRGYKTLRGGEVVYYELVDLPKGPAAKIVFKFYHDAPFVSSFSR